MNGISLRRFDRHHSIDIDTETDTDTDPVSASDFRTHGADRPDARIQAGLIAPARKPLDTSGMADGKRTAGSERGDKPAAPDLRDSVLLEANLLRLANSFLGPADTLAMTQVCKAWYAILNEPHSGPQRTRINFNIPPHEIDDALRQRAQALAEQFAARMVPAEALSPAGFARLMRDPQTAGQSLAALDRQAAALAADRETKNAAMQAHDANVNIAKSLEGTGSLITLVMDGIYWGKELSGGAWPQLFIYAPLLGNVLNGLGMFYLLNPPEKQSTRHKIMLGVMLTGAVIAALKFITATRYATLQRSEAESGYVHSDLAHHLANGAQILLALFDGILCSHSARRQVQSMQEMRRATRVGAQVEEEAQALRVHCAEVEEERLRLRLARVEENTVHVEVERLPQPDPNPDPGAVD